MSSRSVSRSSFATRVFGDSHSDIYKNSGVSLAFTNVLRYENENAPYTMFRIGDPKDSLLKELFVAKESNLVFVFGEPDVRVHFQRQIDFYHRDEDEIVDTLCRNYITRLVTIFPEKALFIRFVIPPRKYSLFELWGKLYVPNGTLEDRIRYTKKINEKLKELAESFQKSGKKVYFIPVIDDITKDSGELRDDCTENQTHLSSRLKEILVGQLVDMIKEHGIP